MRKSELTREKQRLLWEAMDEIFSYLDEDMKFLIFTTIKKLYYLSDEGYKELQKTVEIYKADLEVDGE